MDIFKKHNIHKICDAACDFGTYSLAFYSNGFDVHSFDVSETDVSITKDVLNKYGINSSNVKVASILDTKYPNEMFDGVIGHAILDHLTEDDARKALEELFKEIDIFLKNYDIIYKALNSKKEKIVILKKQ